MKRRTFLTLPTLAGAALPLGGCIVFGEHYATYRFRLTIEIDTPDGVKSGSSVMEVSYGKTGHNIDTGPSAYSKLTGEAVFVDLGGGRHIVGSLSHGALAQDINSISKLPYVATLGLGEDGFQEIAKGRILTGGGDLVAPWVPTLITFSDLGNAKSYKLVYATEVERIPIRDSSGVLVNEKMGPPIISIDEIASTFGAGYRFRRARIDIVSRSIWPLNVIGLVGEPLSRGIEQQLTWLEDYRRRGVLGRITGNPREFTINAPYFVRGF